MAPFRRALILAAIILTSLYLLRRHQSHPATTAFSQKAEVTLSSSNNKAASNAAAPAPYTPPPGTAKQQQLQKLHELRKRPLKEQLAYQFPYNVRSKFPKFIWQTWKYTPSSNLFEEKYRESEASWTELHPGFVHEVVTDSVAKHLVKYLYGAVPEVVEAYNAMPIPILKADFFRYLILLARGGVYADIDTFALKPAQEWVNPAFKPSNLGLVIGIEADPDRPDWHDWYSRRIQFCQWTIQCKPGHPVLLEIVSKITQETLERKRNGQLTKDHHTVLEWTGPGPWTDAIFRYFNDPEYFDMETSTGEIGPMNFTKMTEPIQVGDVVVLPITAFSPGIGHSGAGEVDDPMACVQHGFEGTWKPVSEHVKPVITETPAA